MTVRTPRVTQRLTTRGDAGISIAPLEDGRRIANVLHFTTADGRTIAVRLTSDDLARIRDDATNILAASPGVIDGWLDAAATEWLQLNGLAR